VPAARRGGARLRAGPAREVGEPRPVHTGFASANGWLGAPIESLDDGPTGQVRG